MFFFAATNRQGIVLLDVIHISWCQIHERRGENSQGVEALATWLVHTYLNGPEQDAWQTVSDD